MTANEQALLGATSDALLPRRSPTCPSSPSASSPTPSASSWTRYRPAATLVTGMPSLDADLRPVLLDANHTPVTDPTLVVTTAITTAVAYKFAFVLDAVLPFLRTELSHTLVKQTIADSLGIDPAMARLLLETVLTSPADATQPVAADLLALGTQGLTAELFTTPNLPAAGPKPTYRPAAPPTAITVPVGPADPGTHRTPTHPAPERPLESVAGRPHHRHLHLHH